jgi:hypothetical protein
MVHQAEKAKFSRRHFLGTFGAGVFGLAAIRIVAFAASFS